MSSRVAAWAQVDDAAPNGSLAIGAGDNRKLVVVVQAETINQPNVTAFTVGGQVYSESFEKYFANGGEDMWCEVFIWDKVKIAAMAGSAVIYTISGTLNAKSWAYATIEDCDQGVTLNSDVYSIGSNTFDLVTTSSPGDFIIAATLSPHHFRDLTASDTLAEQYDTAPSGVFTAHLSDGDGGDDLTTLTGDGSNGQYIGIGLVFSNLAAALALSANGAGNLAIAYAGELAVPAVGAGFGAAQLTGSVALADYDPTGAGSGTRVLQTVDAWADALITFDADLGALNAGLLWLHVTNDGADEAAMLITVNAEPALGPTLRVAPSQRLISEGVAFSFAAAVHIYNKGDQDALVYGASGLPAGLTLANGVISGDPDAGTAAGSPYAVTSTCDDADANQATDIFNITVSAPNLSTVGRKSRRPQGLYTIF